MKKIKTIDLWGGILLILSFLIWSLIGRNMMVAIIGYVIVGGWQVSSMAMHAYYHWFNEKKGRRWIYGWITVFSIITMPLGSYILLLFTAPVMASYYAWICYKEVYVKMQRPLALLK